jgi:hypothetical protein
LVGRCNQNQTLIRHAAASGAKLAAALGVHAAAAVARLVSAARLALVAAPDLQRTIRTAVYLAAVASPTDNDLSAASATKKQPAGKARYAAGPTHVISR